MATTTKGAQLTQAHRRAQLSVRARALREIVAAWELLDPLNIDQSAVAWLRLMLGITERHHEESSRSARGYFLDLRSVETSQELIPTIRLAELNRPQVVNSLLATGPVGIKKRIGQGMEPDAAKKVALVETSGAAGRHILNGGRDTVVEAVAEDPIAVGFARVPGPNCCAFCALLATRGYVYKSRKTALFVKGTERRYHDHCACSEEPAFDYDQPVSDRVADLQRIYAESTSGVYGSKPAQSAFAKALQESRDSA